MGQDRHTHERTVELELRSDRGFTFIEIMVVVAILAILAALVIPRIMGRTDDAKRTAAKVQIRNIEGALQLYKLDNGVYPSTEQGLKALVEKPSVGVVPKKWKLGGYLPNIPEDPWGNPYKYLSPAPVQQGQYGQVKGDYEITSFGTDGASGGFTMLEIVLVLFLLVGMLSLVVPRISLGENLGSVGRRWVGAMKSFQE